MCSSDLEVEVEVEIKVEIESLSGKLIMNEV